jgi:hypothetical protein
MARQAKKTTENKRKTTKNTKIEENSVNFNEPFVLESEKLKETTEVKVNKVEETDKKDKESSVKWNPVAKTDEKKKSSNLFAKMKNIIWF